MLSQTSHTQESLHLAQKGAEQGGVRERRTAGQTKTQLNQKHTVYQGTVP